MKRRTALGNVSIDAEVNAFDVMTTMRKAGIDRIAAGLVYLVVARGGTTMSAVAHRLSLPISTCSRMVWELHQLGLINYVQHKGDRRKKILEIA